VLICFALLPTRRDDIILLRNDPTLEPDKESLINNVENGVHPAEAVSVNGGNPFDEEVDPVAEAEPLIVDVKED
jgi:hypothetical protein